MGSIASREEMKRAERLFRYTEPGRLPLAFTYEGKRMEGIPAAFSPVVERREAGENIAEVIVRGRDGKGLEIRVEYREYRDYPVTEFLASLKIAAQRIPRSLRM